MPLYEMTSDTFRPITQASFTDLKVRERGDLQRLLRTQIEVLGDDLYVLTEEFGDWEDSRRRIDLLAMDPLANLVVIELKRTNDGGHMDLQSIRYASMVSAMTFERAAQIHAEFLNRIGEPAAGAQERMLAFLGWEEPDEERFAPDVRIVLVSEDFGKELTTAVLWLRERDIDIRCVRLRPYLDGESRLIDVQQIIPLPEAQEYQVQLREKEHLERKQRAVQNDAYTRFWQGLIAVAHARGTRHGNLSPSSDNWISAGSGIGGIAFNYVIVKDRSLIETYIRRDTLEAGKRIFDQICLAKDEIELRFDGPLVWERMDNKKGCRIKHVIERGYRSSESEWPEIQLEMVSAMSRLETAIKPVLDRLTL